MTFVWEMVEIDPATGDRRRVWAALDGSIVIDPTKTPREQPDVFLIEGGVVRVRSR